MTITFRPSPDAAADAFGHRGGAGSTINLVALETHGGRRHPGDPYLARLRASSAEAARLRESLDLLPLATIIVERSGVGTMRTSFISRAASLLLGIEGHGGHIFEGDALATMFGHCSAEVIPALRELTQPRTLETALASVGPAVHTKPTTPVRVTMTVLEADLGDSILCTLTPRT